MAAGPGHLMLARSSAVAGVRVLGRLGPQYLGQQSLRTYCVERPLLDSTNTTNRPLADASSTVCFCASAEVLCGQLLKRIERGGKASLSIPHTASYILSVH